LAFEDGVAVVAVGRGLVVSACVESLLLRVDLRLPPWIFGDGGSERRRGNTTIHDYYELVSIPVICQKTDILI
jgi:hypothetical protein